MTPDHLSKPRAVGVIPLLAPHCPGKLIRNTDSQGQTHLQKRSFGDELRPWYLYFEVVHWLHLPPQGYLQLLHSPTPCSPVMENTTPWQEQTPPPFGHILPSAWNVLLWGKPTILQGPVQTPTSSGKPSSTPVAFKQISHCNAVDA